MIADRVELLKLIGEAWRFRSDVPRIVEVGVLRGEYSQEIVKNIPICNLWLVDLWSTVDNRGYFATCSEELDKAYAMVRAKFSEDGRVVILKEPSKEASERFEGGTLDFVYLDADHAYESIKADIEYWWPKVKVGGYLAGHDFDPDPSNKSCFGVNRAVGEFFPGKFQLTGEEYHKTWYVRKEN